jgi:hypothetical protein
MSQTLIEGIPSGPHMCPLLLLHDTGDGCTPFNLVPIIAAAQAERLLHLSAVPFHMFRFFGPEFQKSGVTYPLDIRFYSDDDDIQRGPRLWGRPVVLWSNSPNAAELALSLLGLHSVFVLIVSDNAADEAKLASVAANESRIAYVSVNGRPERRIHPDSAALIWTAYLQRLLNLLQPSTGVGNRMAPEFKTPVSLARRVLAANRHSLCPWTEDLSSVPMPWDFVVAPNAILMNFMRFKLSLWGDKPLPPQEAQNLSVAHARNVLAARGLTNFLMIAAEASNSAASRQAYEGVQKRVPVAFSSAIDSAMEQGLPEDVRIQRFSALYASVPQDFAKLAPHQMILLCPSATLAMSDARRNLGQQGLILTADPLEQQEPEYYSQVQQAAASGGRGMKIPQPENPTQRAIVEQTIGTVRSESMHLSAVGVLYATRFGCPVLKLERCGAEVFDPFFAVQAAFETQQPDAKEICARIKVLSTHTSQLFPKDYLAFITERPDCLLHAFCDFPLEFVNSGRDYLGYTTQLSRTPITPGVVPVINYNLTELTTPLPTQPDEFLLVTPFEEDDKLLVAVRGVLAERGPAVQTAIVSRRSDLLEKLSDEKVRCLVYVGHGDHDSAADEGALVLRDHYFLESDLKGVKRVPPLVVLIGCSTAPSASIVGGMHRAFMRAGSALVVGTSFPVPKFVAAHFLITFVRYLLEAGPPRLRDVSDIVTRVRQAIRPVTELYSLTELGRITSMQMDKMLQEHHVKLSQMSFASPLEVYAASNRVYTEILAAHGLIVSFDTPSFAWDLVPYPLFFSTFGFPWTNRNRSW